MSVFQLKQEAGKSFSLGNWYQEGDSKFKVGVVINVIYLFVSIFMLINGWLLLLIAYNKLFNMDKIQLAVFRTSPILAN